MPVNENILFQIDEEIIEDIRHELALQGHYLTGALEQSIKERIFHEGGAIVLSAEALGYIEDLENYTRPEDINISSQEFEGLKRWVVLRGLGSVREAENIARAIVRKWKKEGRPTLGSLKYSKTGERTYAVHTTFQQNEGKYTKLLDHGLTSILDAEAGNLEFGKSATI
jgi:hypothetical protein